ncbi:MAG: 5-formyltetrahydrofolate cyclo-ligase [Verrucomicrobiales bacterium VVV1]|nr:MAG: 5-formyltetrahydrofolate cyclo-ligase [Verrucomicrobiales bacterium VVV1]
MRERLREHAGDSAALRDAIRRWLSEHPECRTVAIFAALPGEPDLLPLVTLHPERRWVLPKVQGDALSFHEVTAPEHELITGAFGIREPRADSPLVAIPEIDVFLCPGLAFDLLGNRLGRGRGFYDRMLEMARPDALKLGVCFPFQLVDDTFLEPHDIRMDGLITPSPAP